MNPAYVGQQFLFTVQGVTPESLVFDFFTNASKLAIKAAACHKNVTLLMPGVSLPLNNLSFWNVASKGKFSLL
jgi:hypothetical protein